MNKIIENPFDLTETVWLVDTAATIYPSGNIRYSWYSIDAEYYDDAKHVAVSVFCVFTTDLISADEVVALPIKSLDDFDHLSHVVEISTDDIDPSMFDAWFGDIRQGEVFQVTDPDNHKAQVTGILDADLHQKMLDESRDPYM